MKNVEMTVEGNILIIKVDLSQEFGPSSSNKSIIISSTEGLPHLFDIIVMATKRVEESKGVIGGPSYPANKYGKVIYEVA